MPGKTDRQKKNNREIRPRNKRWQIEEKRKRKKKGRGHIVREIVTHEGSVIVSAGYVQRKNEAK